MKNKNIFFIIIILFLINLSFFVFAEETQDLAVRGFEVEKVLNLGSGILAGILFIITLHASKRTRNKRLIYTSVAFLLFAIKGFLTSHELFFEEMTWVDPIASFLNFAIILSFFFGVIKK